MSIQASVIICTHNRRDSLALTLTTLAVQAFSSPWEVIVVDNDCSDGTSELVSERAAHFPVPLRVEHEHRRGLSHARNCGVVAAKGEHLIFTDDDVNCLPGFVEAHAKMLQRPGVDGASGRILPVLPGATPDYMREILLAAPGGPAGGYDMGDESAEIDLERPRPLLPFGANMSIRRQLALDLGGFRPDLGVGRSLITGEETEFYTRALSRGARIVYQPAAVVEHRVQRDRVTLDYYLRWWAGWGRASILMENFGQLEHARAIVRQSICLVRDSVRLALIHGDTTRLIKARGKKAFSQSRLAQLIRR